MTPSLVRMKLRSLKLRPIARFSKGSKLGLAVGAVMLPALAAGPLGCESSSSSSGGVAPDGGGVFEPDGGGNPDANVDPPVASECVPPTKGPTMHGGGSTSDPDNDE